LSLDHLLYLSFPWDCFLLEAGFLALFLPATYFLPELASVKTPFLLNALAFQFLVFRVIFGFGKFKFFGSNIKELGYLKYFFINQPILTFFGWLMARFPFWVFKILIAFMFVTEILVPFCIFFPGAPRLVACVAICILMVGIALTGNYGFFNLLTVVACLSLLDTQISYTQINFSQMFQDFPSTVIHSIFIIHFIGSIIYIPFNSWCTRTWPHWVSFMRINNGIVQFLLKFFRGIAPFRMIHSYGVFPPYSTPAVRWIPLIEGSHDGRTWKEYEYHFMPCKEDSPPKFVAPYHPRFDHLVFYENPGFNGANFFVANVGLNNPYVFSSAHLFARVIERLLEGEQSIHRLFKTNPFPDLNNPPRMVRVRNFILEPTCIKQWRQTGRWFKRIYVGVHYPPVKRNDNFWKNAYPDPEVFHRDEWIWKYRSASTKSLLNTFKLKNNVDQAVCTLPHVTGKDIELFWNEFLPRAMPEEKRDFKKLKEVTAALEGYYDQRMMKKYERIFAAYSILLYENLSAYFLNHKKPNLLVKSSFHFGLIIHDAIARNKNSYLKLFDNPHEVNERAAQLTMNDGLYFFGIFHYDTFIYHARRARVTQRVGEIESTPEISGFFDMIPYIVNHFEPEQDEELPVFSRSIKDGQWIYHKKELLNER